MVKNIFTSLFGKEVTRDEQGHLLIGGKTLREAMLEHKAKVSERKQVVNVNKEEETAEKGSK